MPKRKTEAQKRAQGTGRPDRGRHDPIIEPLEALPRAPATLDKSAQAELAKAYVAWRKAALAVDKARLRHLLARYGSYDQEQTAGDVQRALARIDVTVKTIELTDIEDPAIRAAVSGGSATSSICSIEPGLIRCS